MSDKQPVGEFNHPGDEERALNSTACYVPPCPVDEPDAIDKIRSFFEAKFRLSSRTDSDDDEKCEGKPQEVQDCRQRIADKRVADRTLRTVDVEGLLEHWKAGGFKRIVTMVGAGISTSAGIPDFRSPSTGLYHNLRKYNLPHPTAIFDIDYFLRKPQPFFALAKELYPGQFRPTACHYFIRLLHEQGLLHRHYTQNIDTLDRIAGIPADKLVEAHGTFHTNHCVNCKREYTQAWMKQRIFANRLPRCERCDGLVKPDIVFFGENLPERFYDLPERDLGRECDLLIVIGTSLEVHPFAGLIDMVGPKCVRLLINRETVGEGDRRSEGFQFGKEHNQRDVLWKGDCDEVIWQLADRLGYREQLEGLMADECERMDAEEAEEEGGEEGEGEGEEAGGEVTAETLMEETLHRETITTGEFSGSMTYGETTAELTAGVEATPEVTAENLDEVAEEALPEEIGSKKGSRLGSAEEHVAKE